MAGASHDAKGAPTRKNPLKGDRVTYQSSLILAVVVDVEAGLKKGVECIGSLSIEIARDGTAARVSVMSCRCRVDEELQWCW